jgi:hypothetical protein
MGGKKYFVPIPPLFWAIGIFGNGIKNKDSLDDIFMNILQINGVDPYLLLSILLSLIFVMFFSKGNPIKIYFFKPLYDLYERKVKEACTNFFFPIKKPNDVLDYLSGVKFNPVVNCSALNSGNRLYINSDGSPCKRTYCRFGYDLETPVELMKIKKNIKGLKEIQMGLILTKEKFWGKLHSWSAREVALFIFITMNIKKLRQGFLLIETFFGLRTWHVPVNIFKNNTERDLIEARFKWPKRNPQYYESNAPKYTVHKR